MRTRPIDLWTAPWIAALIVALDVLLTGFESVLATVLWYLVALAAFLGLAGLLNAVLRRRGG